MTDRTLKKITVIIPCFNVDRYLLDCLTSVQKQTYPFLEIMLIDDGSTDKTPEICDWFAAEHHGVKVFHIQNSGVSNARNLALKKCTGDYITFVDADDMIAPNYIEALYESIQTMGCDIVYCREKQFTEFNPVFFKENRQKYRFYNITPISNLDYCGNMTHSTVWGCLFERRTIEGLTFRNDIFIAEDSLFFNSAVLRANKLGVLDAALYYYRIRSDSATGKSPYSDKKMTEITSWKEIVRKNDSIYPNTPLSLSSHYCLGNNAIKGIKLMYVNGGLEHNCVKKLIAVVRSEKPFIKYTNISFKKRLIYYFFSIIPHFSGWAYRHLKSR